MTSLRIPYLFLLLIAITSAAVAQSPAPDLQVTDKPPADLLATRSVAIYTSDWKQAELDELQKSYQQIGIDAVAYFDKSIVQGGYDISLAFSEYLANRQVKYLVYIQKLPSGFQMVVTEFNQKTSLTNPGQAAWRVSGERISDMARTALQDTWRSQKKQNFLVADSPETDIVINPITGNRHEFYAIDLKVDRLAVPRFGNEKMDLELEQYFKDNYPLKYAIVDANADEKELRKQGFLYILRFVNTRGAAAREILGYDMTRPENAYASITFTGGQLQLKTIPRESTIYKFYFRHIDNGSVFLGTKWDADLTWQEALRNHIDGFKVEAKIN